MLYATELAAHVGWHFDPRRAWQRSCIVLCAFADGHQSGEVSGVPQSTLCRRLWCFATCLRVCQWTSAPQAVCPSAALQKKVDLSSKAVVIKKPSKMSFASSRDSNVSRSRVGCCALQSKLQSSVVWDLFSGLVSSLLPSLRQMPSRGNA